MDNKQTFLLGFFLLLLAIPLFYNLAGPAIFIFDEAIYANNALEMAMYGDPLVLKNNGLTDLYNTKPPLVIWLQSLCIQILGPTEWAIRLPSALAAFGTGFLLLFFAHRSLKDYRIGLVALLVLVTSSGYLRNHVARSGDLDAMLVFWITFYSLLAFDYLLDAKGKKEKWYFTWIGLGIFLAFLSKSVAGLMPLLGLALAALLQKRLLVILKKPYLYLVAGIVASACLGYYGLREYAAPGYLDKVIFSEYRRFAENIMPWQEQPFGFYWENMWTRSYFMPYLMGLPLALILGFWGGEKKEAQGVLPAFTKMATVFCLSFFLLISYPSVKLNYYDAPLYPFLSLLIGVGVVQLWKMLESMAVPGKGRGLNDLWFGLLLVVLFFIPYKNSWTTIQNSAPTFALEREGHFIRALKKSNPAQQSYKVLMYNKHPELYDQANFYIKGANHYEGTNLELVKNWKQLKAQDRVLCCQKELIDSLQQNFTLEESQRTENCIYFKLK